MVKYLSIHHCDSALPHGRSTLRASGIDVKFCGGKCRVRLRGPRSRRLVRTASDPGFQTGGLSLAASVASLRNLMRKAG